MSEIRRSTGRFAGEFLVRRRPESPSVGRFLTSIERAASQTVTRLWANFCTAASETSMVKTEGPPVTSREAFRYLIAKSAVA